VIYRPNSVPASDPLPYGGSQQEFPYGRESTAVVFSDEGDGIWGFFDPGWVEDGKVRGQLRINVSSSTGHGTLGADKQTASWWAMADDPMEIVDRVRLSLKFAFAEGARQERQKIAKSLLEE